MNDQTIKAIVDEIAPLLVGRVVGRIFDLSRVSLAIDFRPGEGRYLFLSVEPARPGIYLIARRVRDLEKQSRPPSPFALVLRKHLGGASLLSLTKDEDDRVVRLTFEAADEAGNARARTLVAQLAGRAANLLLLDERGHIIDALRTPRGDGQGVGELYRPPAGPGASSAQAARAAAPLPRGEFATLSEAADNYYRKQEEKRASLERVEAARARLRKEVARREKLRHRLEEDLQGHGDAAEHKRVGDLLLANLGTAERRGRVVRLTDYYAEDAPLIELEVDENRTLQEEAARRFGRYTKARRASQEISSRLDAIEAELATLRARESELEILIAAGDLDALEDSGGGAGPVGARAKTGRKPVDGVPGARRYRSSDGYEILVGRAARDNDHLTFRVARPHDLWLHAADYPGSHVVVRNPTRAEIPQRTVIEAAQLAAAFSHAKRDSKVVVHYAQRKFLSKPKGSAPGLVRMSSFRSMTVEPREGVERI